MYPVLFKLGPFAVHAYGFMLAVGFLVGIFIIIHFAKKENIREEHVLELSIYGIIAAIVGSRLMYVIGEWQQYKENLLEIFMVQKGGLAFLGGLLLGFLVVGIAARRRGIPFLKLMDVCAPGASVGYAIARVGCFLNGCCFGHPAEVPWGVRFPFGSLAHAHYGSAAIHPTQIYALLALLAIFIIVVMLWRKKSYDGQIFIWWLCLYAVYRFNVEFFRYCPDEFYWLGLNPGQIIALLMLVAALVIHGALRYQGKAGK